MDFVDEIVSTEEIHNVWLARTTVKEMMDDRDYNVEAYDWDGDFGSFKRVFLTGANFFALTMKASKKEGFLRAPPLLIFWPLEDKLRVNYIRDMVAEAEKLKCNHMMIVYLKSITAFAQGQLSQIKAEKKGLRIEQFSVEELQHNITRHVRVPPHRLLSKNEKADILAKFKCDLEKLPRMLACDPVARYYGARNNQVMEILKPTPDGTWYRLYRVIRNAQIR